MKNSNFTGEQIAFSLRQAERGTSVAEIFHKRLQLDVLKQGSCPVVVF